MKISRVYIRHWISVLIKEKFLNLCLVLASGTSLVIERATKHTDGALYLVALVFLGTYVAVQLYLVTRLANQTFRAVPLPYSVCLGQSNDWFEVALRQQEQTLQEARIVWGDIQRTYRIHRIDWTYFKSRRIGLSAKEWQYQVGDIVKHFDTLTNRVPLQPTYHFFFAAPAPITLALGATIGRRAPSTVYQHAGNVHNPYVPIFSTEEISPSEGYHQLNKRIVDYQLIDVARLDEAHRTSDGRVVLVLDFTGHELPKPYPLVEAATTEYVTLKQAKGHIPLTENWIDIAHEIASAVFAHVDDDREVHLVPGIPSSLAFVVGTIIAAIPGVVVYHYNRHDEAYTEGLRLNAL